MTTSLAQKDYLTTLSNGDTITFTDNSYMNGGDNNTSKGFLIPLTRLLNDIANNKQNDI